MMMMMMIFACKSRMHYFHPGYTDASPAIKQ